MELAGHDVAEVLDVGVRLGRRLQQPPVSLVDADDGLAAVVDLVGAAQAEQALTAQDTRRLGDLSLALKDLAGAESAFAEEISGRLAIAATVINAAARVAAPAMENAS